MCWACVVNEHEACTVTGCDGCAVCLAVAPDERRYEMIVGDLQTGEVYIEPLHTRVTPAEFIERTKRR